MDIVPICARELERHALGIDPLVEGILGLIGDPKRPEVDVFNVPNVVALIHEDTSFDRIASDIPNQVPVRADQFDGLVGIEQATISDSNVLRVFRIDAGWIWHWRHVSLLPFRISNNKPGN